MPEGVERLAGQQGKSQLRGEFWRQGGRGKQGGLCSCLAPGSKFCKEWMDSCFRGSWVFDLDVTVDHVAPRLVRAGFWGLFLQSLREARGPSSIWVRYILYPPSRRASFTQNPQVTLLLRAKSQRSNEKSDGGPTSVWLFCSASLSLPGAVSPSPARAQQAPGRHCTGWIRFPLMGATVFHQN